MKVNLNLIATVSRFAIAAAIVYFAYQLSQINNSVGDITQSVDDVSRHIPPTLDEVREIRLEIAAVRQQVPPILDEIKAVRAEIPAVLARFDEVNNQVDPILQRVDRSLDELSGLQRRIPAILASTDAAVVALNETREQVVPLVPPALEEIRLTRDKVDPTLDRVDTLVDGAFVKAREAITEVKGVGREAGKGAVTGFISGLFTWPFDLVGSIARPVVKTVNVGVAEQLSERDLELIAEAGARAGEPGRQGEESPWHNPRSGNSGSITITRRFEIDGYPCVETRIRIRNPRKEIHNDSGEFCRGQDGAWMLASEIG